MSSARTMDGLADVAGGAPSRCWCRGGRGLLGDDARAGRQVGVEGRARAAARRRVRSTRSRSMGARGWWRGDARWRSGRATGAACVAQVVERGEGAAVEEGVADVLDAVLDLALRLRVAHGRGHGLEEVVPGEVEEARIELDRAADVVQDDALEVVVEDALGDAAEELERAAVHRAERSPCAGRGRSRRRWRATRRGPSRRRRAAAALSRCGNGRRSPSPPGPARPARPPRADRLCARVGAAPGRRTGGGRRRRPCSRGRAAPRRGGCRSARAARSAARRCTA